MIPDSPILGTQSVECGALFLPGWITGVFNEGERRLVDAVAQRLGGTSILPVIMRYAWSGMPPTPDRVMLNMLDEVATALRECVNNWKWERMVLFAKGGSAWLVAKVLETCPDLCQAVAGMVLYEPILDVSKACETSLRNRQTVIKGVVLPESWFESFIGQAPLWRIMPVSLPVMLVSAELDEFALPADLVKFRSRCPACEFLQPPSLRGHNMTDGNMDRSVREEIVEHLTRFLLRNASSPV